MRQCLPITHLVGNGTQASMRLCVIHRRQTQKTHLFCTFRQPEMSIACALNMLHLRACHDPSPRFLTARSLESLPSCRRKTPRSNLSTTTNVSYLCDAASTPLIHLCTSNYICSSVPKRLNSQSIHSLTFWQVLGCGLIAWLNSTRTMAWSSP